jgi:hypothetical protein
MRRYMVKAIAKIERKSGSIMDKLINILFKWDRLKDAIFDEVHLYDELNKAIAENDGKPSNLSWIEGDLWYGWAYNQKFKRYYFDDTGYKSIMDLFHSTWDWDIEMNMGYL